MFNNFSITFFLGKPSRPSCANTGEHLVTAVETPDLGLVPYMCFLSFVLTSLLLTDPEVNFVETQCTNGSGMLECGALLQGPTHLQNSFLGFPSFT